MARRQSLNSTLILLGILFLVAGIGYSQMMLVPALKESKVAYLAAESAAEGYAKDLEDLKAAQKIVLQADTALSQKSTSLEAARAVMPIEDESPQLFVQMEALFKAPAGLSKPEYSLGKPAVDKLGGVAVPINMTVEGKYDDLKKFMVVLQQNIRPVSFTSFSFGKVKLEGGEGGYSDRMLLTATGSIRSAGMAPGYDPANVSK